MSVSSNHEQRQLVRRIAEAYLDPQMKPRKVRVEKMAKSSGLELDAVARLKVARYALATAVIHKQMRSTIAGEGVDAHFIQARQPRPGVNPLTDLEATIKSSTYEASTILKARDERFRYLLAKYILLSQGDPLSAAAYEDFIFSGGDLALDGRYFVGVTAQNMNNSELTQKMTSDDRILATHGLIHIATGRATQSIEMIGDMPNWIDEAEMDPHLAARKGGLTLLRQDGSRLFFVSRELIRDTTFKGPRLHCPAHRHLLDFPDTALELGLHATVNLAGSRQIFSTPNLNVLDNMPGDNLPVMTPYVPEG